ncbi:MAG: TlyA family RNA methyltransferase [Polyangiaceae bacterium]
MSKVRVDQLLVDRGLAESKSRAQAYILAGDVHFRSVRIDKPGTLVPSDAELTVKKRGSRYVSRGGDKLEGAILGFGVEPKGKRALDVGASTGGFTDCLLEHGAASVVAVDVGYGQLAAKLRSDPRVDVRERTNARTLTPRDLGGEVDLVVVDASFIGLEKLLPAIAACLRAGGELVALVKPQFEVGEKEATRSRGVIRDADLRKRTIEEVTLQVERAGFDIVGVRDCVLAGPKGNLEAFVYATRRATSEA